MQEGSCFAFQNKSLENNFSLAVRQWAEIEECQGQEELVSTPGCTDNKCLMWHCLIYKVFRLPVIEE